MKRAERKMTKKSRNEGEVVKKITGLAGDIYNDIKKKKQPVLETPIRSLSNVKYDEKEGYFELLGQMKSRTLTAASVKTFAQTLKMMTLSKTLVETDDIATKREAYYVSKNWGDAGFKEQPESDTVMDDVEAAFMVNREQLGFIPEEKGGDVAGKLNVIDVDPETGKEIKIDCTKFGSGSYSIPSSVETIKFETKAEFILAIETAGMHQRLVKHAYWKKANCILISMGGVPTRACRRFIRRLSDEMKLPVYAFTDGDPYGWLNIYRTLKVGSGNAAHINKYFCVP
ncbi:DNA topoisomerase VI, partial [Candidatus Woesearchaeota archaeon]|nr:DNA topoisomerase VI [Candidatus Woesearchaeota archaeon]